MVRNLLAAMRDDILSRPWMSDDTKEKAMAKIATFNPKIGYPDKWKDYSHVEVRRDAFFDDMIAGRKFVEQDDRAQIGKTGRPRPLGNDAAHLGRLLQSAAERNRLPRRNPAAARFRHAARSMQ